LALSMAATKMILGSGEGGHVIQTFGEFVLGGNFVVGFVSFLILMIVQFVVITQGATRVSEVVARFTLDAMPGKQMAIDADMASGLIDEQTARKRRKAIKQEADFYGAMDGASKFVKGDAVASLLIIAINIIGGFVAGMVRGEGDALTIVQTYTMLSVGEGLVSQIPALLISTSSGLLVTRAGQEVGMGGIIFGQLTANPRVLGSAGVAIAVFGLIPGFPTLIFLLVGGGLFVLSRVIEKNPGIVPSMEAPEDAKPVEPEVNPDQTASSDPDSVLPLISVDTLEIELGYGLTKVADPRAGGDLTDRIGATRRQIALELGYVMPGVRIRDNALLSATEYVVKVRGEEVARAVAEPDLLLAIDSGMVVTPINGVATKEPVFGLDAVWIEPKLREMAERNGYACVEASAMISTHLAEVVKNHSAELLSRQDVVKLVDQVKETHPSLVGDLNENAQMGDVQKVLQHLLRERVPIRDLVAIFETVADYGQRVKDPEQLGELVRASIARTLTRQHLDEAGALPCIALDGPTLQKLQESVQQTPGGVMLALGPDVQGRLLEAVQDACDRSQADGRTPVVVVPTQVRLGLKRTLEGRLPSLAVLAYNEVTAQATVEFCGTVSLAEPAEAA
ncbi:MAG: flagellar biosynthesis protein FlhA, partial [Fimbriimonadaceae bacterium]|nr:flagellar biosynthesis protein FlhA [Fimbriimonadaceae bacterium]